MSDIHDHRGITASTKNMSWDRDTETIPRSVSKFQAAYHANSNAPNDDNIKIMRVIRRFLFLRWVLSQFFRNSHAQ